MAKKIINIVFGVLLIIAIPLIIGTFVKIVNIESFSIFGFKIELFDFLSDKDNVKIEFKDYLSSVCALLGIIITSFLSYLIWKLNKKSVQISEKLIELEFERDGKITAGSAAMIYIVSYSMIEYLHKIRNGRTKLKFPYFNDDFLKSAEKLYGILSSSDLAFIFEFYNDFSDLQEILVKRKDAKIIDELANKYFEGSCLEYSFYDFHRVPEFLNIISLLKFDYQEILGRIDCLARKGTLVEVKFPKAFKAYYKNGKEFYNITINEDGKIEKQFWDLNEKLIEKTITDDMGITGYKIDFEGKTKKFEGQYMNGKRYHGTEYNIKIADSDGYDYFRELNELEMLSERANDEEDHFDEMMEKSIESGQIGYDEFCTGTWEEGKRVLNTSNSKKEPRY